MQQQKLYSSGYIYTSCINALLKAAMNSTVTLTFQQDLCKIKQWNCIYVIVIYQ